MKKRSNTRLSTRTGPRVESSVAVDDDERITIFPAGTYFHGPDPIHQVTIEFPDEASAILFFEWCRQQVIDAEEAD